MVNALALWCRRHPFVARSPHAADIRSRDVAKPPPSCQDATPAPEMAIAVMRIAVCSGGFSSLYRASFGGEAPAFDLDTVFGLDSPADRGSRCSPRRCRRWRGPRGRG